MDTNNKDPQIRVNGSLPSAEIVEIQEKSPIQTLVTTVPAPDADRDSKWFYTDTAGVENLK